MSVLNINSSFDVFGLGHTLVDVSVTVEPGELDSLGMKKGEQKFVAGHELRNFLKRVDGRKKNVAVGGNVRNTLQGLALFGDKTCYSSQIGSDERGASVQANLRDHQIADRLSVHQHQTGACLILVSEDGERSILTFGGDENDELSGPIILDDILVSKIFYTSGYVFNHLLLSRSFERGLELARQNGTVVGFDLADPHVVAKYKTRIRRLLKEGSIDILFGNHDEFTELFGADGERTLADMRQSAPLVVVKLGARGAMILTKQVTYDIPAKAQKVIDTTGAGDIFAAGFLHGLLRGYAIDICGYIGALVAGDSVAHIGVKLSDDIHEKMQLCLERHGVMDQGKDETRAAWIDHFVTRGGNDFSSDRKVKIQVCGMRNFDEARNLLAVGVDVVAFPLVLPVHKEDVSVDGAAKIIHQIKDSSRCVLITYLNSGDDILALAQKLGVKKIQLHGDVDVEELKKIKAHDKTYYIVKSLIVRPEGNWDELKLMIETYGDIIDAFIIDTYDPSTGATGATGKTQDWNVSRRIVELSPKPVILAGGLSPDNVYDAVSFVKPFGITVHTGVESKDGFKDLELVERFLENARRAIKEIESSP